MPHAPTLGTPLAPHDAVLDTFALDMAVHAVVPLAELQALARQAQSLLTVIQVAEHIRGVVSPPMQHMVDGMALRQARELATAARGLELSNGTALGLPPGATRQ